MRIHRLFAAIRANPYIVTAVLSGVVTLLGVFGLLPFLVETLQGSLSVALGIALAVSAMSTRTAIRKLRGKP